MKKALVYGTSFLNEEHTPTLTTDLAQFELIEAVRLQKTRSNSKKISLDVRPGDIVQMVFEDHSQWIGAVEDIPEIYGRIPADQRSAPQEFTFDAEIKTRQNQRGVVSSLAVELFKLFRPKLLNKAAVDTAEHLAASFDQKVMPNPGLYRVDGGMYLSPCTQLGESSGKTLLLLHGTLSTTLGAFGDLKSGDFWKILYNRYKAGVLALEHETLSKSPLHNVVDLLQCFPDRIRLDLLAHSRGGVVADVLARCDHRNELIGFSDTEIELMEKEDSASAKAMQEINQLARSKTLEIDKTIRVATPASGTTILSKRVDHFFNGVLNAIGLTVGGKANVLYSTVQLFLLEVVRQKESPEAMPGLNAMMPESTFQKILNNPEVFSSDRLFVIAGDAELGSSLGHSLKVIFTNLFYRRANDFVVDSMRMEHGLRRQAGLYTFLSKDSDTNHFNYFRNSNSREALKEAVLVKRNSLPKLYTYRAVSQGDRGVLLRLISMSGVFYDQVSGNRPIVLLIPGIMGSTLDHAGSNQWIDFEEISKGGIKSKLHIQADEVKASGVIKSFYNKLALHLKKTHDVITYPFDWRRSVSDAAKALAGQVRRLLEDHNQPVKIVAHSMGGLVARQFMMDFPELWKEMKSRTGGKLLMLGTPWLGSYLIMEVLSGHARRVKQLAMLDFRNNKKDLLKVFREYPGIFELLPVEEVSERPFWESDFWAEIKEVSGKHMVPPLKKDLTHFKKFRERVLHFTNGLEADDLKQVYYLAGKADETVFDYKLKDRTFGKGQKLVYLATPKGDGSVTWETGIPNQLPADHLYYCNTEHGELANDEALFPGIVDLLKEGRTSRLAKTEPVLRSGNVITEIHEEPEPMLDPEETAKVLFGISRSSRAQAQEETPEINVRVTNGDLKVSQYPVMVGHFFNDMIFSAEKALDGYLEKRLSHRHDMGYYPGKVGESEVFFNLNTNPRGAIIAGLGEREELTHYLLSKTVEMATLKYAMFMRDNYTLARAKRYAEGISFLLIGTGYGRLQIEDSVRGIILGVAEANKILTSKGNGLKPITQVEFINYYEEFASQAYWALNRMRAADQRYRFNLVKGIETKEGSRKRRAFEDRSDWWHNFTIQSLKNKEGEVIGFKYSSSSGLARVEEERVHNGLKQIKVLLEKMAQQTAWDKKLSKTLFELLIPNSFKDIIRNQNNIVLKMDTDAAQFPWEMFHDFESDETPAAVNSGLMRQLYTADYRSTPVRTKSNTALVVGDPLYEMDELTQLPAAKQEALFVDETLRKAGYKTIALINAASSEIMLELYTQQFKMLHFSGHGLYDPKDDKVGIVIGDGILISPAMLGQLSYVPEFVFINCCFSGKMNASDERYYSARYDLAANVGPQLIRMGVKAIMITGWAVDDAAAETFAQAFYHNMIAGYEFGEAAQEARKSCYQQHGHSNTWAAYQCYGDQHYKFHDRRQREGERNDYVLASQVHIDLDNLYSSLKHLNYDKESVLDRLREILENATRNGLMDGAVREREALIYDELDMPMDALDTFRSILELEDANFSVKVLEHFCLLRSLNLSAHLEQLEQELEEISKLGIVGRTSTRLNIVGNAYKFATQYTKGQKRLNYLLLALESYTESYRRNRDPLDAQSLDAVSNMILCGHLLESEGDFKLKKHLSEFTELAPVAFCEELLERLKEADPKGLDVSSLIGVTEISFCLLLLTDNREEEIVNQINDYFEDTFQLLNSKKRMRIERLQIKFLESLALGARKTQALHQIMKALDTL
ncbi:DUF7379 domain-containing protein [Croceiramulus getboli]|nr:CHAT domain-containing protein [Flavobacteriaceae bacterium YJPT1-3]